MIWDSSQNNDNITFSDLQVEEMTLHYIYIKDTICMSPIRKKVVSGASFNPTYGKKNT